MTTIQLVHVGIVEWSTCTGEESIETMSFIHFDVKSGWITFQFSRAFKFHLCIYMDALPLLDGNHKIILFKNRNNMCGRQRGRRKERQRRRRGRG